MLPDAPKHLEDMRMAGELIVQFATGRSLDDYTNDALLRSAIERQLTIIREALVRLAKADPTTAAQISEYQKIIAFGMFWYTVTT
jgi:uncharacterized protein with HEPN domain